MLVITAHEKLSAPGHATEFVQLYKQYILRKQVTACEVHCIHCVIFLRWNCAAEPGTSSKDAAEDGRSRSDQSPVIYDVSSTSPEAEQRAELRRSVLAIPSDWRRAPAVQIGPVRRTDWLCHTVSARRDSRVMGPNSGPMCHTRSGQLTQNLPECTGTLQRELPRGLQRNSYELCENIDLVALLLSANTIHSNTALVTQW